MPQGFPQGFPQGIDPMEAFFGQGGPADPRVVQELFAQMAGAQGMHFAQGAQAAQQSTARPAASKLVRASLPRVKVTPYDIASNESPECSICLDELTIGQPAIRIPCGHLYHEDCVKEWLEKSNECPVCRFELPTDDAEYERGRKDRMAGRKIRFRHSDLTVKTVTELRRLANFVNVDLKGCLEKGEMVERIEGSSQVLMIPDTEAATAGAPDSPALKPSAHAMFSTKHLEGLSIQDVKALMAKLGVDSSSCPGKEEMVQLLVSTGYARLS